MTIKPRRLRSTATIRSMVQETRLHPDEFIAPLFIKEGIQDDLPVASMPGIFQHALNGVGKLARNWHAKGVKSVLLFGIPQAKDEHGSGAYDPKGIVHKAIAEIKSAAPELVVIADVCLCEYTSHGHCGIIDKSGTNILNEPTLPLLAQSAVSLVKAGADIVAPSDMMDGRVAAIRKALQENDLGNTPLMSYAVKYASALYGPFRDAAENTPTQGDRRSYQMDPANAREALREARLDENEGADFLIVKPAGFFLDIIRTVSDSTQLPVVGYQVSGEYSMLKAAIQNGWMDEKRIILESLLAIRRAGARQIISYFSPQVIEWL